MSEIVENLGNGEFRVWVKAELNENEENEDLLGQQDAIATGAKKKLEKLLSEYEVLPGQWIRIRPRNRPSNAVGLTLGFTTTPSRL